MTWGSAEPILLIVS